MMNDDDTVVILLHSSKVNISIMSSLHDEDEYEDNNIENRKHKRTSKQQKQTISTIDKREEVEE